MAIIRNLRQQTQLQTLWKSEENLVDLHATEMVQCVSGVRNAISFHPFAVIPGKARNPMSDYTVTAA
jgi:hypothetical protein